MGTFLFDEVVFGPVYSRRLGISLGINLLPLNQKVCSFNCIYCECGKTTTHISNDWVDAAQVDNALSLKLQWLERKNYNIDTITFAGNGEPTLHPQFPEIVEIVIKNRNIFFPNAQIAVLSNSSTASNKAIFEALKKVNLNILKLDVGSENLFKFINNPLIDISLHQIIENLSKFNGNLIIQTLLVKGTLNGKFFNNTCDEEINLYLEHLKKIKPHTIMVYPICRDTPYTTIEKVSIDEIKEVASKIKKVFPQIKVLLYT